MNYEIIEDCSPYYIRYRHDGSQDVINFCRKYKEIVLKNIPPSIPFIHHKMPVERGTQLLAKVYGAKELELMNRRVSLFVTQPNYYYRPHKDGMAVRTGINYNVDIRDDKCVTSWYSDETFKNRPIDTLGGVSREIGDYNRSTEKALHTPLKSMTAVQGEVVLFNTDLYHDVDNTDSSNERTILTLRSSLFDKLDYFQARKFLFGF